MQYDKTKLSNNEASSLGINSVEIFGFFLCSFLSVFVLKFCFVD